MTGLSVLTWAGQSGNIEGRGVGDSMDSYVEARLSAIPGHIGFYYQNLDTGEVQTYHALDRYQDDSVIKLPILAAVFLHEQKRPGILSRRILVRDSEKLPGCGALQHIAGDHEYDVLSLCRLMITLSDNTATNALIRHFGIDTLNEDFSRLGLEDTRLYRLLFDAEAASRGKENLFQPRECGLLLERLYRGTCVSSAASERMLAILLQQQINHKIPGRLPAEFPVAHKTGEDTGITNDLGIVYGNSPFILAFASNETDVPAFEQTIRDLSFYFAIGRK